MFGKYLALAATAILTTAVPSAAQKEAQSSAKERDPNQVVCEKVEVLGSRVSSKKVCMTRAEWAERRRLDRLEVEKVQMARGQRGE